MKKFYKIFIVMTCLLSGVLSSCDYLDVVPDEKATEKDAFEDKEAARRFVYSCYAYIPNPRNGTESLDLFTADEVVTAFEHERFASFPKGNYSASNPVISYWNSLFQGIKQCYILLNNIDMVPALEASVKADYIAQAKFLIGYYHFLLVHNYGPVILVKEEPSLTTPADQYAARSPYDECVDFVCQMLDEAAEGLPATRLNEYYGLATSVAAKSIKARLLLYAASPLFNGNSEFYADFKAKDGTPLMHLTYDANKWQKAKSAYEEAIRMAEAAGFRLYTKTDYFLVGYENIEPVDPVQHTLRYAAIEPANPEIIWADCRSEGAYSVQNKSLPFCNGSAYNGVSPTLAMLKRFYTKKGLPVDVDPDFPKGNSIYDPITLGDGNASIGDPEAKTIRFNLDREPRFYSWVGFQGGFYEILSSTDGKGSYQDDDSYNKYNLKDNQGKLVCDFVIGGNTSRQPAGESLRTNNYSPTGYLNKKGVVPGYPVRKELYNPPFYPWPVIRLAELYLGYAEACVECNDLPTAKTYLNMVRERAGIPDVDTSWSGIATLDQNRMREIVRQECMIEFYLENQTFWDLRRWKEAEEYLGVKAKGMNILGKTIDEFGQETEVTFERKLESPTQYLMPIPVEDINRNQNLAQNPGY
ncbi:MAG: RagB/SusD family nutrient uptake outer membrane protein [Bacteroides sp.]|nr:RagB/SusD family nutrient uptake outer membrane protein [Bacteroides sp.]